MNTHFDGKKTEIFHGLCLLERREATILGIHSERDGFHAKTLTQART